VASTAAFQQRVALALLIDEEFSFRVHRIAVDLESSASCLAWLDQYEGPIKAELAKKFPDEEARSAARGRALQHDVKG